MSITAEIQQVQDESREGWMPEKKADPAAKIMSTPRPTPETAAIFDAYARCACGTADIRLKMEKLERERDEAQERAESKHGLWMAELNRVTELEKQLEAMREAMREAAAIVAQIPVAYDHRFFRAGQWANAAISKLQPFINP